MNTLDSRDLEKEIQDLLGRKQRLEDAKEARASAQEQVDRQTVVVEHAEIALHSANNDFNNANFELGKDVLRGALQVAIEVLDEAKDELDDLVVDLQDAVSEYDEAEYDFIDDDEKRLENLLSVKDMFMSEWVYGLTFIPYDDWEEYVQELLMNIGVLPSPVPRYIVIDWEATADNVANDYTSVTIGDMDYYVRG